MLSSVLVSVALCVPGGHSCGCDGGPGYSSAPSGITGPPVVQLFERRAEDNERRANWNAYCRELDQLWTQYRAAGSTPEAWRVYVGAVDQAKLRYVANDLYFVPIVGR
jgi:hypothetical protein